MRSPVKLSAHPVMVAVALGFLGPAALDRSASSAAPAEEEIRTSVERHELARVEQLWIEARDDFDRERKG